MTKNNKHILQILIISLLGALSLIPLGLIGLIATMAFIYAVCELLFPRCSLAAGKRHHTIKKYEKQLQNLEVLKNRVGEKDPEYLKEKSALGVTCVNDYNLTEEALEIISQVVETAKEIYKPEHEFCLANICILGGIHFKLGERLKGIELVKFALSSWDEHLDPDVYPAEYIYYEQKLYGYYKEDSQIQNAIDLGKTILDEIDEFTNTLDDNVFNFKKDFAIFLSENDEKTLALKILDVLCIESMEVFGPKNNRIAQIKDLIFSISNGPVPKSFNLITKGGKYGNTSNKQLPEESDMRRVLRYFGQEQVKRGNIQGGMALIAQSYSDFEIKSADGTTRMDCANVDFDNKFPKTEEEILRICNKRHQMVITHLNENSPELAIPLAEENLEFLRSNGYAEDHQFALETKINLCLALIQVRELAKAIDLSYYLIEHLTKAYGEYDYRVLATKCNLINIFEDYGDDESAKEVGIEALKAMVKSNILDFHYTKVCLNSLTKIYDKTGNKEELEELKRSLGLKGF
jgi:hypothetical protein